MSSIWREANDAEVSGKRRGRDDVLRMVGCRELSVLVGWRVLIPGWLAWVFL